VAVFYKDGASINAYMGTSLNQVAPPQNWCRPCMVEAHVLPAADAADGKPAEVKPTLEDFIREIVRDEFEGLRS